MTLVHDHIRAAVVCISAIIWGVYAAQLSAAEASDITRQHQNLTITVRGNEAGLDLVFIPGLTSHWTTFEEVCAGFSDKHQCHLIQLPGFAGYPPLPDLDAGFMVPLLEQVASYLNEHTGDRTLLTGHSLGGALSMMVAATQPEGLAGMVLVDSLPFLPAVQNPAATVDAVLPMATQMRRSILAQSRDMFDARVPMNVVGLSNNPAHTDTLIEWGIATDQATMAYAMYDLQTLDLRPKLVDIKIPTLILGSWAAYADFGSSMEFTRAIFEGSYRKLPQHKIALSETGYHFLMWDDKNWVMEQMNKFIDEL